MKKETVARRSYEAPVLRRVIPELVRLPVVLPVRSGPAVAPSPDPEPDPERARAQKRVR